MSDKIEFIEVDGRNFKVELFPDNVRQLVTTFEIIRGQYNSSAITTAALGDYMNRVSGEIQELAKKTLADMMAPVVEEAGEGADDK